MKNFCLAIGTILLVTTTANAQYYVSPSFGLNFPIQHVSQKTDNGKYIQTPYSVGRNLALHIGKRINKWEIETGIDYSEFMLYTQFYVKRPDICPKCDMGSYSGNGFVSWSIPIFLNRVWCHKKWQYGLGTGGAILNYNTAKPSTRGWAGDDYTFALIKSQNYNGWKPSLLVGTNLQYMLNKHHQFNLGLFYNYGLSQIMRLEYRLDLHYNGVNETYFYKTSYKGDYIGLRLSYRYLFNFKQQGKSDK